MMTEPADLCDSRTIHEDRIQRAREHSLGCRDIDLLARTFKAMGDPTRLKVLWALRKEEMCVCDIAALLGKTESAVSHQLRILRNLDLVANRRDGTVLYYRLNDQHVDQLINLALEHVRE